MSGKSQQPSREEADGVQLRAMETADYAAAFARWRATEGIGLNRAGASFWEHDGWRVRTDLRVMQKPILPGAQLRLGT